MDDIELLRHLGHDVPPADPVARQAARDALVALAMAPTVANRATPRLVRVPRLIWTAASIALAATVVLGVLPMVTAPSAAASALNRAADVAAGLFDGTSNGYRHTKSVGAELAGLGGTPDRPNGIWTLVPVAREIWIAPDGSGRLIETRGEPTWFGPADKAAWEAAGRPDLAGPAHVDTRFGPTPPGVDPATPQPWPGSFSLENVDALPTDTAALRQFIDRRAAAAGAANDYERFTIVGDLLRETVAAPKLRAALYRVAAGLGGVELIGSVTDRAGRPGIAVAMTNSQSSRGLERRTLIFDPQTSMLLAEEDVLLNKVNWLDADPPIVIGYNTYLVSDIVPTIR